MSAVKRKTSAWLKVGGVVILIFAVVLSIALFNKKIRQPDVLVTSMDREAWPVKVSKVERSELVQTLVASGTLEPRHEVTVTAEVTGKVVTILADLGDRVSKGQRLLELDTEPLQLALRTAKAQLAAAEAALANSAQDLKRKEELFAKDHISSQEVELQRLVHRNNQANIEMAKVAVDNAQRNLRESGIRSPIDGLLAERFVDLGEYVLPQMPLCTVVESSVLKLTLGLSELQIGRVESEAPVSISMEALPGRVFPGIVSRIGVAADRLSGAFPVEVLIENAGGELLPGMSASATIETNRHKNVIAVSRDVVLETAEGQVLFVVEGDTAIRRKVLLGPSDGRAVVIETGLSEGELLVVAGQTNLSDGTPIRREEPVPDQQTGVEPAKP